VVLHSGLVKVRSGLGFGLVGTPEREVGPFATFTCVEEAGFGLMEALGTWWNCNHDGK
jgi:hypothetical protein